MELPHKENPPVRPTDMVASIFRLPPRLTEREQDLVDRYKRAKNKRSFIETTVKRGMWSLGSLVGLLQLDAKLTAVAREAILSNKDITGARQPR